MNLPDRRQGFAEDPEVVRRLLEADRVGSGETYLAYPSGWTQASNTPYRYYKRTPMAGGIRVPFIAHWPRGIAERGALRRQWIHVTDVLPTPVPRIADQRKYQGAATRGPPMKALSDGAVPAAATPRP